MPLGSSSSGNLHDDLTNNTLPSFSFIVPTNPTTRLLDGRTGDNWLGTWVPLITSSTAYQSGNTALFIVWDEGNGGTKGEDCTASPSDPSCLVAALIVNPYTPPGTLSSTPYSHYSLLRTTEDLLGLAHLAHAADTSTHSFRPDFHL